MAATETELALDTSALDRGFRAPRRIGAAVLIAGIVLAALTVSRALRSADVRADGSRINAVVMSARDTMLYGTVRVRYDAPDGRILEATVPVTSTRIVRDKEFARVAYDAGAPERVVVIGAEDPRPWLYGLPAAGLIVTGAMIILMTVLIRRRSIRSLDGDANPMRAFVWSAKGSEWVRLDAESGAGTPSWWVRLAPRQDSSKISDAVVVHGSLPSRSPVVLAVDGEPLWSDRRATASKPRGAAEGPSGPQRARWGRLTVVAAILVTAAPPILETMLPRVAANRDARVADRCRATDRLLGARSTAPDPSAPATVDQTSALQLAGVVLAAPSKGIGFDGAPKTVDGYLTLEEAAATRRDGEEGERILRRYGYVGGYRRDWEAKGRVVTAFVYEFSTAANASAFDAYANRYVCAFGADAFAIDELPGAVGNRIPSRSGTILEQASFVRGARRFLVGLSVGAEPEASNALRTLVADQARAAR